MEEVEHVIQVLNETKKALQNEDTLRLKDLSNQTIHCATTVQDNGSIIIAVIVYSLSKILERKDNLKIKNWLVFVKKFNLFMDMAIKSARDGNESVYEDNLARARRAITSMSVNLKPYIMEIVRKASINKASKIYEHGISLGRTAELLGLNQWELSEYMGQSAVNEAQYNKTISAKERVAMAMEFFS